MGHLKENLPQAHCRNNPGPYRTSMARLNRVSKMSYIFLLKALGTAQGFAEQNEREAVTEFLRTHTA